MRISGTLKFYNTSKGFDFIAPGDGSKDVFVHASALERSGIDSLNEGGKFTFVLEDDRKGRGKQAGQIQKSWLLFQSWREVRRAKARRAGGLCGTLG